MNQVKRMADDVEEGGGDAREREINIVAKTENERLICTSQDNLVTCPGARSWRASWSEGHGDKHVGSVGSALPLTVRFPLLFSHYPSVTLIILFSVRHISM